MVKKNKKPEIKFYFGFFYSLSIPKAVNNHPKIKREPPMGVIGPNKGILILSIDWVDNR